MIKKKKYKVSPYEPPIYKSSVKEPSISPAIEQSLKANNFLRRYATAQMTLAAGSTTGTIRATITLEHNFYITYLKFTINNQGTKTPNHSAIYVNDNLIYYNTVVSSGSLVLNYEAVELEKTYLLKQGNNTSIIIEEEAMWDGAARDYIITVELKGFYL